MSFRQTLFSLTGRLPRLRHDLLSNPAGLLLHGFIGISVTLVLLVVLPSRTISGRGGEAVSNLVLRLCALLLFALGAWSHVALTIERLHVLGLSGLHAIRTNGIFVAALGALGDDLPGCATATAAVSQVRLT